MTQSPYPTDLSPSPSNDGTVDPGSNGATMRQQPLIDRMAQGAHHTIDRLAETAAPHLDRMDDALAGATGQLKERARQVREKGDEWTDDLRANIRRNPLTAVVAALAIGALVSRITR